MTIRFLARLAVTAVIATGAVAAAAHDFFLLPSRFSTTGAGNVAVQATVSASFPRLESVVTADRIATLRAQGPGNPTLRVVGPGANALNLTLSGARPGLIVAGTSTVPRDVEYPEDRIGIILEEYRITPSAVAAVERLTRPRTLQVSSRRFAKTMVCAGRCTNRSAAARALGFALEFVAVGTGSDHFRLLSNGRPLPNHPVDLVTSSGERRHLSTDASGQVHLAANARGSLMLFAALMTPPASGGRFVLDLSSLTFSR